MKTAKIITTTLSIIFIAIHVHGQGSLTPPGAPAATMKTLAQIEPRTPISSLPFAISNSGSYYVTSNLTCTINEDVITITAANVTLDLNGFTLTGAGAKDGIALAATAMNVTIRSGTLTGWNQSGINGHEFSAIGTRVENIRAVKNTQAGMAVGHRGVVQDCYAEGNGSWGILARGSSRIIGCTVKTNLTTGIDVQATAVIQDCLVSNNGGTGINTQGFNLVNNCEVSNNGGDGIRVSNGCYVFQNVSHQNEAAGIHATSSPNRIDSNNVTENARGVDVDAGSNFIIRNSAGGNGTNYDIAANNKVGTVVAAPNSGAISGSTGGAGVGTTDPWANFSY